MDRLVRVYRAVLGGLVTIVLAALLAIMGMQIVARYGFNASLIWAEEMCRYLLIWASFLAAALSYERGEVAAVTMLRDALPRVAGLVMAIVVNMLGVVLLVVLVWYGLRYAARIGSSPVPALKFLMTDMFGPGTPVPSMYWVYFALPLGLALLALRIAADIVLYARMIATGEHAGDLRASQGMEHAQ